MRTAEIFGLTKVCALLFNQDGNTNSGALSLLHCLAQRPHYESKRDGVRATQ